MVLRKRLLLALGLLLILIVISTTGYRVLGGPSITFLQALYMAVITLAGVGYGEIVDTSHNPATARVQHRRCAVWGRDHGLCFFDRGRLHGGNGVQEAFLEAQNAASY